MASNDLAECFIFYGVADSAFTEHDAELLWRVEHLLETALKLLSELSPATRRRFPILETGSYPPDPDYDGELVSLDGIQRRLPAYALLACNAQGPVRCMRADFLCIWCLASAFARSTGKRPGTNTEGPFTGFVQDVYAQQGRKRPSVETIKRVVRTWKRK